MNSEIKYLLSFRHITFIGVLCLFFVSSQAQIHQGKLRKNVLESRESSASKTTEDKTSLSIQPTETDSLAPTLDPLNNKTLVYLENAQLLTYDEAINPDMKILKGDVRFRHDNTLLYCDSAYFYEKANSLDAFSNVRIVQGDTIFVYGDFLYYDGNTKLARLRHNVKMVNRKTTLTTDSLNYDRIANLAYYYTGGKIVDPENRLTSTWGQYSTTTNDALFRDNVNLKNKNFTLDSDTLQYNTNTNIANIVGETHILYQDETNIYSKSGWYNTTINKMMLLKRSLVVHKDGNTIIGDTVFYDKVEKYGEAFDNVELTDSASKSTLYGDYIYYNEASEVGLANDSAFLMDWSTQDTLWVHGDTLRTYKDSIYNVVRGYYNVRIFRNDVQGICDSLVYSSRDTVINFHGEPVLWAGENQISGELIQAFIKDKKMDHVHVQRNAIAIQKEDTLHFNQLSGKEIFAYMDSSELKRIDVNGNAETIYYPKDDADSTLIGINKTESSFVTMYLKNKQLDRVVLTSASSGTMYPLANLSGSELYLKNFFWIEEQRPMKSEDVLLYFPKKTRIKATINNMPAEDTTEKKPDAGLKDKTLNTPEPDNSRPAGENENSPQSFPR